MKDTIEGHLVIPRYLGWLFKRFITGNYWDTHLSEMASSAIHDEDYGEAGSYIENMIEMDGQSEETARLVTRINRIEVLSGEHSFRLGKFHISWWDK